jgi:hypothetical protein
LQPLLDVVEGVHVGDIVDDADAVGAAVVGGSDGSEALLAGGIPLYLVLALLSPATLMSDAGEPYNLQLHGLAIQLDRSDFLSCVSRRSAVPEKSATYEVNANGGDVGLGVGVVGEAQE